MKKLPLALGVCVAAAGYLSTVYLVDQFDHQLSGKRLAQANLDKLDPTTAKAVTVLTENGCRYCHTPDSELPFYASVPGAKQLMEHDIQQALRQFNVGTVLNTLQQGKPVSDVDLAKIESVVREGRMPPKLYLSMHWGSHLSEDEKAGLLDWVKAARLKQHPGTGAADAFKNDPVQPITTVFPVNSAKVALGKKLYHDTRLSGDDTVSCATCHPLSTGGVDRLEVSVGVNGAKGPINAPTVFNAAFNTLQFWDGRAKDLQAQAGGPPLNPLEMASTSWAQIVGKLAQDPALKTEFAALYPEGISEQSITDAIAEFEKTLVTPNSRFDRYLKGDEQALNAEEKEGYALFKANQCSTCHAGEAMGGQSFELMGVKKDYFADRGQVTEVDNGRFNVTKDPQDKYRFKVPTLRNVALTPPYFHDAQAKTLEDAIGKMAVYQVGVTLPPADISKIAAFLKTLNGEYAGAVLK